MHARTWVPVKNEMKSTFNPGLTHVAIGTYQLIPPLPLSPPPPPLQMIEGSSMKRYDSIQKLLNETSHLKQAISAAERLKLFPLHRLNSSKRPPQSQQPKITALREVAEDEVQNTHL